MPIRPYTYELDYTGQSPDNYVYGEVHDISPVHNRPVRAIAPNYGAFYNDSLIVIDHSTGVTLVKDQDYTSVEFYELPSAKTGKEIFSVVLILNQTVSDQVRLNYQTLGGEYSLSNLAVQNQLNTLDLDNRQVAFLNIQNKPERFNPAHHLHDIGDVYGFEYITLALDRIRHAILFGDVQTRQAIYDYIDQRNSETQASVAAQLNQLAPSLQSYGDAIANLTSGQSGMQAQINAIVAVNNTQGGAITGLQNSYSGMDQRVTSNTALVNAATQVNQQQNSSIAALSSQVSTNTASIASLQNASANTQNINNQQANSIAALEQSVQNLNQSNGSAGSSIAAHIANKNNPHETTKTHVGLGNVQNYAVASMAEAQAGTANDKYMTPAGVSAAVPYATKTVPGKIRLASTATDADTTNANNALTAESLAQLLIGFGNSYVDNVGGGSAASVIQKNATWAVTSTLKRSANWAVGLAAHRFGEALTFSSYGEREKALRVVPNEGIGVTIDPYSPMHAVGGKLTTGGLIYNFYFDAQNGNDANDGFTEATAKKTVAGVDSYYTRKAAVTLNYYFKEAQVHVINRMLLCPKDGRLFMGIYGPNYNALKVNNPFLYANVYRNLGTTLDFHSYQRDFTSVENGNTVYYSEYMGIKGDGSCKVHIGGLTVFPKRTFSFNPNKPNSATNRKSAEETDRFLVVFDMERKSDPMLIVEGCLINDPSIQLSGAVDNMNHDGMFLCNRPYRDDFHTADATIILTGVKFSNTNYWRTTSPNTGSRSGDASVNSNMLSYAQLQQAAATHATYGVIQKYGICIGGYYYQSPTYGYFYMRSPVSDANNHVGYAPYRIHRPLSAGRTAVTILPKNPDDDAYGSETNMKARGDYVYRFGIYSKGAGPAGFFNNTELPWGLPGLAIA